MRIYKYTCVYTLYTCVYVYMRLHVYISIHVYTSIHVYISIPLLTILYIVYIHCIYVCSGDETLIFAQPIYLSEVTSIPGREGSPVRVRVQDGGSTDDSSVSVSGSGSGGMGTGFEPQWRILPSVLHLEILQLLQTSNRDSSEQGDADGGDGGIDLAAPGIHLVLFIFTYWHVYVCMHSYDFTMFIYTAYNILLVVLPYTAHVCYNGMRDRSFMLFICIIIYTIYRISYTHIYICIHT